MSETKWEAVARLESAVAEASARLRALRAENDELRARLEELEDERRRQAATHQDAWQAERLEVAERVERLAGGLESLLGELSPSDR
jgi:chromosome segregation ATPase